MSVNTSDSAPDFCTPYCTFSNKGGVFAVSQILLGLSREQHIPNLALSIVIICCGSELQKGRGKRTRTWWLLGIFLIEIVINV